MATRRAPLGQHFLRSPSILDRIAREAVSALGDGLIVEIGAGPGALTTRLLSLGAAVVAIEMDPRLARGLRDNFRDNSRLEVVEADILEVDLAALIAQRTPGRAVVAGNLPYYITSPILRRIFEARGSISEAVLLIQKEVAARVVARPGTRDYGYLSVLCQAHSRPRICFTVPPGAFRPAPKVTSALVRLAIDPLFEQWSVAEPEAFLDFAQLCFHQKRKTLLNNLQGRFERERLAGLPEARLRAEQLSPAQLADLWLRLAAPRS
ncbi:MAG TPA: 16S rRNA (adenine(1518)-N(6)/adenine(1519)-N(6))-dimethyltransferase RsmA [Bryobacterales bacterium]|nr:16S rRNA (adenine(1518)-N(6)/adenine(1519)-N(6))-dimethyltransferase RsmA [Bryobacterales bacterium]